MSQPPGRSLDPKSPVRRHMPRTPRPRLQKPHSLDPVSIGRRSSSLTGGNIALWPMIAAFVLYTIGHLTGLNHLFDRSQASVGAHTDVVARGIAQWLPAGLAISAGGALAVMAFFSLRDRLGRHKSATVDNRVLKAAMANVHQASARRASRNGSATAARRALGATADKLASRKRSVVRPACAPSRVHRVEAARLRRDFLSAAKTRVAAAGKTVADLPPVPRTLSDSMPTLPFNKRVRRRDPRGTLPPAVAAALKLEVASQAK